MSQLQVHKASAAGESALPIFEEFEKLSDRLRIQAFNLFSNRGAGEGHALEDWLAAEQDMCWPAAELTEEDGKYVASVALAGFESSEIDIAATPEELMLKARHEHKKSGSGTEPKVRWSEFRSNDVFRRIAFPSAVVVDKIKADFENGLLRITAPIAPETEESPKRIAVKSK